MRNAEVSAQLVVYSVTKLANLAVTASVLARRNHTIPPAPTIETRYVGYVPVYAGKLRGGGAIPAQIGGHAISGTGNRRVVADPLWSWKSVAVPAHAAQPVWFTVRVPATAAVGDYDGRIRMTVAGQTVGDFVLQLTVQQPTLPAPGRGGFSLNVWFNPDALAAAYHVSPWSAANWTWIQRYLNFLARAGQRTILTAIVQHPWRVGWNDWRPQTATGYSSLVEWSFDGRRWRFNYARFDRYVDTARQAGLGPKIVAYSPLSFRGPQRITFLNTQTGRTTTRVTPMGSPFWEHAWCAFTRSFAKHLEQRGWLAHTWLGFDERPTKLIEPTMALLRRCAPEFLQRTQMTGTQKVGRYAQNLSLGWSSLETVPDAWIIARRREGKVTTFYTWAGDLHPNTLTYSPAVEARMLGWIGVVRHLNGYLHWAFDDWPHDVFRNPVYGFAQGDEYFVYPGPHGPISSIRWELLKAGIEDAELVRMAERADSHSRTLAEAVRLATRNPNGDTKDVHDIIRAHAMVVSLLDRKYATTHAASGRR